MDRAYTVLEFRAVDDAARIIEGVASTDAVDSYGTVLEPRGAKYALPMPLLWQHDSQSPVGHVLSVSVESDRIRVRAQILKIDEAGPVRDTLDRAWQNVKHGLVRGLSVGFEPVKTVGKRFTEWKWRELSLVTLPATPGATIEMVRSAFAASGEASHSTTSPGVSGTPTPNPRRPMKTYAERIAALENKRAANLARMEALSQKAEDEGRTKDEAEQEEFTTLHNEVTAVDTELVDVRALEKLSARAATPVNGTSTAAATQSRSGAIVTVKPNVEPGIGFARHVMALCVANGDELRAADYAKRTWGDGAEDVYVGLRDGFSALQSRAAVAPGSTTNSTFAAPFVNTTYLTEFLDMLRPMTLLGRIPKLRHVPFNISMPAQTAGGTYSWVGQGKWKPVTNAQYAAVTLAFAKAAGIIVLTEELVRLSTPSAEAAVRDELAKGLSQFLDVQLVDSSVAAVSNVSPASITNGVTGTAASGATGAAARSDIAARVAAMVALGYSAAELVILMSESIAFNLGLMLNDVGAPLFPGLGATGGNILGIPVVTSQSVGSQIVIAHGPSILMADENGIEIDVSREASLQLNSAPTDPIDATATLTSLWQANLVGLRVERFINWGKARSTAVDRITSAAYAA